MLGDGDDLPVTGDWNGDRITDLGVFDQATATFTLRLVDAKGQVWTAPVQLGAPGDLPVAGDWDGNGITDLGVWTPTTATFVQSRTAPMATPDQASAWSRRRSGSADPAADRPGLASGGRRPADEVRRPVLGSVSANVCTPPSAVSAKATVPGRNTGFLKATSTVTASGRRFSIAAIERALVHMPCAICRGKPSALAVSG